MSLDILFGTKQILFLTESQKLDIFYMFIFFFADGAEWNN